MKSASTILSAIALLGVIILFGLHFSSNKSGKATVVAANGKEIANTAAARIAYIDIDSFEANYLMLKTKKEDFNKRQDAMNAELQRSAQQIENDARALQAKAGAMSQAEGEAASRRLGQMQQSFQTRKETMEETLRKEQIEFQETLHKELDDFLEEYNNEKHYDYILSYSHTNPQIMYVNKQLNVTDEVVKAMNARPKAAAATPKAK